MPDLTPTELGYLRGQDHNAAQVDWYLAVAPYGEEADDLFTARVNDATIDRGEREIVYDNEVGEADVVIGMTLWVGSSAHSYDKGMIRIKDIDTGTNTITVAENDHISWSDDDYLTVPGEGGFFELWSKYQRLVNEGEASFEVFKDYDVDYTNQGDHLPPKANAGPPACAWIDDSGNADIDFIGVYSYATEVGEAISSYTWDFADGAVISGGVNQAGTEAAPNTVRFTSPGFRYVSLTVTDSLGTSATVYVPVWVFESGVEDPYKRVEVLSLANGGDGWNANIRVHRTNSTNEEILKYFPDGALIVLFTKTSYDGTEIGVGGYSDRENIEFVGWLDGETLDFNYAAGNVEFTAVSTDGILKQIPGFSFPLEEQSSPSNWMEMRDLNVDRALHFLFEYHTTVNLVCHVDRVGEANSRSMTQQRFPKQSVFEQANDALLYDAQCALMTDRQGLLRARRNPQFLSAADRASDVDVVCELTEVDWLNRVEETRKFRPKTGYVKLGGFDGDSTPMLSIAPGVAPNQSSSEVHDEGYIVTGQTELNLWSGLRYTLENLDYPSIPLELYGFWPVFDPALQEYVELTFIDPLGRVDWSNEKFIVRAVSIIQRDGTALTQIDVEHENDILTGETQDIPEIEEPDYPNPPPPPPPSTPDEPPSWENPPRMALAWTDDQVGWTDQIIPEDMGCWGAGIYGSAGAEWVDVTPSPLTGNILDIKINMVDDETVCAWLITGTRVYYTPNILSVSELLANGWSEKLQISWVDSNISSGWHDNSNYFAAQQIWWGDPDYLIVGIRHAPDYRYASYNAYTGGFAYTLDGGDTWSLSSMPNDDEGPSPSTRGGWTNVQPKADGVAIDQNTGYVYAWRNGGLDYHGDYCIVKSTDRGATFTEILQDQLPGHGALGSRNQYNVYGFCHSEVMSPSQLFIHTVAQYNGNPFMDQLSTDAGVSISQILPTGYSPNLKLGAASYMYNAAKFAGVFQADSDSSRHLMLTEDSGGSWSSIGEAVSIFSDSKGGRVESWPGSDGMWFWVCREVLNSTPWEPRIAYTPDDGVTWCDVTGNWISVFGTWSGGDFCGLRLLPRVGDNA